MSETTPTKVIGLRSAGTGGENPKDAYGLAKVPLSLIPMSAKILMAMGLGEGARKYGEYNWRVSKVRLRVYLEAAMRHIEAFNDGEDIDEESGVPHIGLALATLAIAADGMYGTPNGCIDDRPIPGLGHELLKKYKNHFTPEKVKERADAFRNSNSGTLSSNGSVSAGKGDAPKGSTSK